MYFFFNPGGIITVLPDPVPARAHEGASFTRTHFRHTATGGVSGAKAQPPLPAVCLPLLSVLQVSRSIWAHLMCLPNNRLIRNNISNFLSLPSCMFSPPAWPRCVVSGGLIASWFHTLCASCGVSSRWCSSRIPPLWV